jgi:L-alanine-DL-glutamate epimerase-like enolase superfamily enzyme
MPLRLQAEILELKTRHPFIIARGTQDTYRTVHIRLTDEDGLEGWGEAAPQRYYGETPETVLAALNLYATALPDDPVLLDDAEAELATVLRGNSAARAGLSAALHDLAGKRLGHPVHRLFGLDARKCPPSTFTIGIDTPDRITMKVREADPYPILKVKLGTNDDVAILQAIRDGTSKELRVDANGGWTRKQAVRMLPVLEEYGVTVLEQPLPPDDLEGLAEVTRCARIPVIADESCRTAADIPRLVGKVDGINIKLAKTGSLREALRMIALARAHHMVVMVGCMIESSIGITAAAQITPLVDLCDLDGAALLGRDPFVGASIESGQLRLPEGPGLGLSAR